MAITEMILRPIISDRPIDAGLRLRTKDEDLIKAKLYLLIDLDRIQDALVLVNQQKGTLSSKIAFEKVTVCQLSLTHLQPSSLFISGCRDSSLVQLVVYLCRHTACTAQETCKR